MEYQYITDDNLENRQSYMYAKYGGAEFIDAYYASRAPWTKRGFEEAKEDLPARVEDVACGIEGAGSLYNTANQLLAIWRKQDFMDVENKRQVDFFVKKFEVSKRLFTEYDDKTQKPVLDSGYRAMDNYLILAAIVEEAYAQTHCLKYLSCLLKLEDTLLSIADKLEPSQLALLRTVTSCEVHHIRKLADEKA